MLDIDIIGQLIPNPISVLVQLCSTLVLFLIAKKLLWPSVKNWMEQRANQLQDDVEKSQMAKEEALADRAQAAKELSDVAKKSQDMVEAAVAQANKEKQTILDSAKQEAELEKQKAQQAIEQQRKAMYDALKNEVVNLAMDASEKLIGSKNMESLDQQAIFDFVKETEGNE